MGRSLAPAIGIALLVLAGCAGGGSSSDGATPSGAYAVLAWNDLGMHCINPTFDKMLVLPPFNTVWAQVVKRGDPPALVTSGITVEYSIAVNTYSSGKRAYGGFWTTIMTPLAGLLGITPVPATDVGLTGNDLSGAMTAAGGHFVAVGIPVTPVLDSGVWNPYQVAVITVKDSGGATIAQTRATVPVSDEMSCADCHGTTDPYGDMIAKHNTNHGTTLAAPVICAECHADPALGAPGDGVRHNLSRAMHGWHSSKASPTCYQCHPGPLTQCSRSTRHTASGGNCASCHGDLAAMAAGLAGGRAPWAEEPKCVTCHPGVADVDTGAILYRNALGHGGLACAACHGSPHAMIPTNQVAGYPNSDAYQSQQYQGFTGKVKSIGSCGVCHTSSRGDPSIADFAGEHGGPSPDQTTGCNACHTSTPTATASWPHAFQWNNSN